LVFTFPTRRNGKPVVLACSQRGSNLSHRIIPIGTCMGGRSRTLMGIGWCSRTRRGPYKESSGTLWPCPPTAAVLQASSFQGHGLTTLVAHGSYDYLISYNMRLGRQHRL
jgi:hypothetical protein